MATKLTALTPTLSLSLWERVGVRASSSPGTFEDYGGRDVEASVTDTSGADSSPHPVRLLRSLTPLPEGEGGYTPPCGP